MEMPRHRRACMFMRAEARRGAARHGNMDMSVSMEYARENDMLTWKRLFACMCPYNFCGMPRYMEVSAKCRVCIWMCAAREVAAGVSVEMRVKMTSLRGIHLLCACVLIVFTYCRAI